MDRIIRRENTDAVEQIPIRFIMSIAILAAILILVLIASNNLRALLAEHQVEEECRILESSLSTMIGSGVPRDVDEVNAAEGTKRIQTFVLPDSLIYLSFGGDPETMNTDGVKTGLTDDGAVICYKVQGGSKKMIWLPAETYKFREGTYMDNRWVINGDGYSYVTRTGGKITLTFERVTKNHQFYILVHGIGGIDK
jgi:hypothetical protein